MTNNMKTIEEAAREAVREEYLCEKCAFKDDCNFCGGENTAYDCCECPADSYEDGFKAGVNHIMSLPLCDRMTSEERDRLSAAYGHDKKTVDNLMIHGFEDSAKFKAAKYRVDMLEYIFGTAMFGEKGEKNDTRAIQ